MARTVHGKLNHQRLAQCGVALLKSRGIKNIFFEVNLGFGAKIDILGIDRNNKKIGVECLVVPQFKTVNEKITKYRKYLDELIFSVPTNYKEKVKKIQGVDKVICVNMPVKTIKINPRTHQRLVNIGKKAETFDDIINKALDITKRKYK